MPKYASNCLATVVLPNDESTPTPFLSKTKVCQKQKFAKKNKNGLYSNAKTQLEQNSNLQKGSPTM
jgi:hypothetical protein